MTEDFDIVNFALVDGDIPHATSYGLQVNTSNTILTAKLLKQGIGVTKSVKLYFQTFVDAISTWYPNLMWD